MCILLYSKKMVNGRQAGSRAREESDMHACRASTSVYGTTCVATVLLSSNTQLEEVKKFAYTGWTKCLVKPATIQCKKCTGMIDIGRVKMQITNSWTNK